MTERTWFCILTLKGKTAAGATVSCTGRGKYALSGTVTMKELYETVFAQVRKESLIESEIVVVYWFAAPNVIDVRNM